MIIATIMLIGAILFMIQLFTWKKEYGYMEMEDNSFSGAMMLMYLVGLIFFVGSMTVVILSMFQQTKCISKWVMLGVASLTTILMVVAGIMILTSDTLEATNEAIKNYELLGMDKDDQKEMKFMKRDLLLNVVTYGIVFGLLPLCYAIKKVLKCCGKKEATPAPKK